MVPRTVYTVLVAIDAYRPPVPPLRGCVNDARAMEAYLQARTDPGSVEVVTLLDAAATRDAVISAFRTHLGQAGPEDVAFFCYSGHGSQEQAPPEFWHLEPDRLDETLVLYDTREPGKYDLSDKELALLIDEVGAKGADVCVLLDCCHSGSGTRAPALAGTAVRRAPTDLRPRPIESFLGGPEFLARTSAARDLAARPAGWNVNGRHVLLAACRDDEEAKEYAAGGQTRGAFSHFLGETLRTLGGDVTYADLFARVNGLIRGQVQRQSPQLEAYDADDLRRPFLGGAIRPAPRYFTAAYSDRGWSVDAGRAHGIPAPAPDDAAAFSLYDFTASDGDLADPSKAVGNGEATAVAAASCRIEVTGDGGREIGPAASPLKAVLVHVPTPRLAVRFEGDPDGVEAARRALAEPHRDEHPSLFVREAAADEIPDYRLLALRNEYLIAKPDDDRPLVAEVDGFTDASACLAIARLAHIARWRTTAELENPTTSIRPDEVAVDVLRDGVPLTGQEIRLEYGEVNGKWAAPRIRIRLQNNGERTLYAGLLDLPETFGVFPMLRSVGSQRLDPGQETFADGGQPIPVEVPKHLWERGVIELKDVVKLIVSTSEFDVRRLAQADLDGPRNRSALGGTTRGGRRPGTLARLMERVQGGTRHFGQDDPADEVDDWRTLQFTFTTVRPLPGQRLEPGHGLALTGGVRVEPHPALRAVAVRVSSLPVASRSLNSLAPLPRLLYDDPAAVQPFELAATRSAGGQNVLSVLELDGVGNPSAVTPADPLTIVVPRPLPAGEHVLAVGFDGEFYLPLGRAEATDAGETRIVLDRLPVPTEAQTRTLGGSLKILFHKVVGRALGADYRYPVLAAADVGEDLKVRYEPNPAAVRERVKGASRIALFVHGIIGDTRDMAAALRRAGIADHYDLVLTFDYENLQDRIDETARGLKRRLSEAGLAAGHGKSLDVIAHSMGGLVSRWFIEREGGEQVVRRLVMLGTPNGGSPWSKVEDWALTALAVGLNGLAAAAWPAAVLAGLAQLAERVDVALDQMAPESDFLKELHASPDPKVPYVLIAGDTSLIPGAAEEERRSRLSRLLGRLWSDRTKYDLADKLFFGAGNDIAVSTKSMGRVAEGRAPVWRVSTVACDHLTYFGHAAALERLANALQT